MFRGGSGRRRGWVLLLVAVLLGFPAAGATSSDLEELFGSKEQSEEPLPAGDESVEDAPEPWLAGEELTDLRTESSATYRGESPGVFRTELHSAERFFEDAATGKLVELDASLVAGESGWEVAAAPSELRIPAAYGGERDAVSLMIDGAQVSMGFRGAEATVEELSEEFTVEDSPAVVSQREATEGVLEDGVVRYEAVAAGVDVLVEPTRHGVKETLVLANPDAPRAFEYWIDTDLTPVLAPGGGVHLAAEGDVTVAVIPAPYLQDSSEDAAGTGFSYEGTWEILDTDETGRVALRLTAHDAWLDDPERVWPVLLDPTLEPFDAELDDTYTFYGASDTDRSSETVLKAGNSVVYFRSFIHFDDFDLSDKFIWDATLHLYQTGGSTGGNPYCTNNVASELQVRKVTSSWTGSNVKLWSSQPSYTDGSTPYGSFSSECGATWVSAPVTGLAAEWAGGASNYGVALREPDSVTGRRDFNSMNASSDNPYLEVYWSDEVGLVELPEAALPGGMSGEYEQCVDNALFDVPIDGTLEEYVSIPGYELATAAEQCVARIFGSGEFRLLAEEEDGGLSSTDLDCRLFADERGVRVPDG